MNVFALAMLAVVETVIDIAREHNLAGAVGFILVTVTVLVGSKQGCLQRAKIPAQLKAIFVG